MNKALYYGLLLSCLGFILILFSIQNIDNSFNACNLNLNDLSPFGIVRSPADIHLLGLQQLLIGIFVLFLGYASLLFSVVASL